MASIVAHLLMYFSLRDIILEVVLIVDIMSYSYLEIYIWFVGFQITSLVNKLQDSEKFMVGIQQQYDQSYKELHEKLVSLW